MSDLRKAAEMALNAMVSFSTGTNKMFEGEFFEEIKSLRQALAHQDKECVAIVNEGMGGIEWLSPCLPDDTPLYAESPKREWVGLTDQQIFEHECWDEETAFHVNKTLMEKNT